MLTKGAIWLIIIIRECLPSKKNPRSFITSSSSKKRDNISRAYANEWLMPRRTSKCRKNGKLKLSSWRCSKTEKITKIQSNSMKPTKKRKKSISTTWKNLSRNLSILRLCRNKNYTKRWSRNIVISSTNNCSDCLVVSLFV